MGGRPVLTRAAGEWARPRPQPQPAGGSPVGCLDRPGPTSPACFRASCVLRAPGQAAWFDVQWLSASRALLRAAASEMETCPVVPTSLIITDQGTAPPRPRGCTALSRAWPTAASLGTPNKVGVTGTWLHIIPHPSPSPLEVRVCWPPPRPGVVIRGHWCRRETGPALPQAAGSARTRLGSIPTQWCTSGVPGPAPTQPAPLQPGGQLIVPSRPGARPEA